MNNKSLNNIFTNMYNKNVTGSPWLNMYIHITKIHEHIYCTLKQTCMKENRYCQW